MLARDFLKTVLVDRINLLDQVLAILRARRVASASSAARASTPTPTRSSAWISTSSSLSTRSHGSKTNSVVGHGRAFPHSLNVSAAGSDRCVQIQTDPRYAPFVERAVECEVLGITMPVAAIEDVLQGNIWAAENSTRQASKRHKYFADIARLLEVRPDLRPQVPESILQRLI